MEEFDSLLNSDSSIYYMPDLPEQDRQRVRQLIKSGVDLTYNEGTALVRSVERYGVEFLRHVSSEVLTHYLSNEHRSVRLSAAIASRYIKLYDDKSLIYLLKNDMRENRDDALSYQAMIMLDILPNAINSVRTLAERKPLKSLWRVVYEEVRPKASMIRRIIRTHLLGLDSYKDLFRESGIVQFTTEAYIDHPTSYDLNDYDQIGLAYRDEDRIFPLQDSDYDVPSLGDYNYEIELYLRMCAQYLSSKHTLASIIPWKKIGAYSELIKHFIINIAEPDEIKTDEEMSEMLKMLSLYPNHLVEATYMVAVADRT